MQLDDMPPKEFGLQLKVNRLALGMTVEDIAQALGISPRTWNGIEQGRRFRFQRLLIMAFVHFNERFREKYEEYKNVSEE